MNEEEFKEKCPNLYSALNAMPKKQYELYGMKFLSHSPCKYYDLIEQIENKNCCVIVFNFRLREMKNGRYIMN